MLKENILITAKKKGFTPLTRFISVSGIKNCFVTELIAKTNGDIVDKRLGVIYHKATDTWAEIISQNY